MEHGRFSTESSRAAAGSERLIDATGRAAITARQRISAEARVGKPVYLWILRLAGPSHHQNLQIVACRAATPIAWDPLPAIRHRLRRSR